MEGAKAKLVILGAGGLAREVHWILQDMNHEGTEECTVLGFIAEDPASWHKMLCGLPVLGDLEWVRSSKEKLKAVCAVGSPRAKKCLVERAKALGLEFCTLVHPSVQSSKYVDIGRGTVVAAGCILTTHIRIADHVFLNLDTTVGHDAVIEDFVNVAPGCHISGNVVVREGADLGTGAVVLQGIVIGRWAVVGAGAVVIKDVPDGSVVVGVPAKVIRYQEQKSD